MIDSILFAVDVPAGTYTEGQVLPMSVIRGPSVVRDGYGEAHLKRIISFASQTAISVGTRVRFKNANWNDSLENQIASVNGNQQFTIFAKTSPAIQRGGDVELQPNSAFEVNLIIGEPATTTVDNTVFLLADIDYPQVAAIANPADEKGMPVSITRNDTVTVTDHGNAANAVWTTVNVDQFKAGYRYLLAQVGCAAATTSTTLLGFVAFSGAASMNGLVRIIPVLPKNIVNARIELEYSAPLVKGPMNIEYAMFGAAGTEETYLECDYIRR